MRAPHLNQEFDGQFAQLARRKCEVLAKEGVVALPYLSESLPHFSKLPQEKKNRALHELSETIQVFEQMLAEGQSLRDNPKLIWRSMHRLGLTPRADVFDKITDEHLVVVFGLDQRQIFRNLEFLKLSILTLEELYATEWFRYTRRDPEVVRKLKALMQDFLEGKADGTFDPQVEEHVIEQVGSAPGPVKLKLKIDYVSPLMSDGKLAGVMAIERAWPVEWQGLVAP